MKKRNIDVGWVISALLSIAFIIGITLLFIFFMALLG